MRTTLTIEPDVEKLLRKVSQERRIRFKELVNAALRLGLTQLTKKPRPELARYSIKPHDPGPPRLPNIDSIGDVLAFLDGDQHR